MIEARDAEHVLGVSEPDISRSACMSRPILDIKLRLPDGTVVTGKSRNVPGALEHLYWVHWNTFTMRVCILLPNATSSG
jgi:hypothetical protein